MPLTFGSLFSGIGGLDLGLERAGMECKWQVEYDDYCNRVLAKHWPEVKRYGDITAIDKCKLEKVDLICGGFPCQPFSHAGKRKGTKDDRWLWPQFLQTIQQVKPRWVLVENVPGLLSIDSGRVFSGILRDLAESGYDAFWGMLRASDVGAPHRRERLFIVAHAGNVGATRRGSRESKTSSGEKGRVGYCLGGKGGESWDIPEEGKTNVADPCGTGSQGTWTERAIANGDWWATDPADLAHPENPNGMRSDGENDKGRRIAEAEGSGIQGTKEKHGPAKSFVGRVAYGVPNRVDRLKGLGNAVVPQVAEYLGRLILEVEGCQKD